MIESVEWLASFWSHRMLLLLYWSFILPMAWLATVSSRRLSPRVRSWIWRIAYLKLFLVFVSPFALEFPIPSFGSSVQSNVPQSTAQAGAAGQLDVTPSDSVQALSFPRFGLALAWCSGVLFLAARYFAGWWRVYRLVSAADRCSADSRVDAELKRLRELMSVDIPVELRVSQHLLTPCVFGVLRPTVLIPNAFHDATDSDLRNVLAHELAHIARHDLAWNLLQTLVSSVLFFHPLIWMLQREWRLSQELACDEIALCTTKSSFDVYASLILRLSRPLQIPSLPPAAVGVSDFPLLRRRLMMLQDHSSARLQRHFLASLALVCVSVMLLAPWQPAYAEKDVDTSKGVGPAPAYRYEEVAKSVMQRHKVPYYKLTVGGLLEENDDEYVPSLFMAKGISTTMSVGPKSKHVFTIGSRKGEKVELTCLWEQQVSGPRSVKGQRLWTSNFTAFSTDIELGKEVSLELVSPSNSDERKTLRVTVQAHVVAEN